MLKLNSALNLDVGEFLRWWWSEIESLLPEKARSMLVGTRQLLIARPEEGGYSLTHFLDGKEIPLGTFEAGSIGKAQLEELLEKKPELSTVDWVLRLQKQDAIQKRLVLPAIASENLEQVVQYELDRFTPFTPGQVYFAVKVLEKNALSNQLEAQLILTPRERLDACYNELREWGVRPVVADYQEFSNRFENKRNFYNLLPLSLRLKQNRMPDIIVSGLVFLVVILFCLVLITPVWMEHETVEVLDEQVARVEKEARKVESLKTEIDDLYAETRELIRLKKSSPSAVEIINTMSRIIDDNTWLSYLQFSGGNIQIQGESPAASSLIEALETAALFENVRFVSPVTQDKRSGMERFQITAHIAERDVDG